MRTAFGARRPSPLLVRVVSGSVILVAVVGLVLLGLPGLALLATVIGGAALWEFRLLSERMGWLAPAWLIFPLGALLAFSGTPGPLRHVSVELVISLSLVVGLGVFLFLPGSRQGLGRWAMGVAGAIYIGMPFHYYLLLYADAPATGRGLAWILFTILAVAASDIAALLVGMRLGRHGFFNWISPKKTLEGAIAGVVLAVLVMVLGGLGVLHLPLLHTLVLGALVGVTAELGDLVESQMKRIAGVKDSSNLIPGHGGVLDRIDSVLFPPIVVYFYALQFHLL
jgi:phosphatidate cytidylyltransferase